MPHDEELKEAVIKHYAITRSMQKTADAMGVSKASVSRWTSGLYVEVDGTAILKRAEAEESDDLEKAVPIAANYLLSVVEDGAEETKHRISAANSLLANAARHRTSLAAKKVGDALEAKMLSGAELMTRRQEVMARMGLGTPPRGRDTISGQPK